MGQDAKSCPFFIFLSYSTKEGEHSLKIANSIIWDVLLTAGAVLITGGIKYLVGQKAECR